MKKLTLSLFVISWALFSSAQCWTFSIGQSVVLDEPGGATASLDGDLNVGSCFNSSVGLTAVKTGSLPDANIQLVYNGNAFNFVGGEAVFVGSDLQTDIDFIVNLPSTATCTNVFNVNIEIKAYNTPTDPGNPDVSFTVRRPKANLSGPATLCNNSNGTYSVSTDIAVTGAFTYSIISSGSGWKINGAAASAISTTATSIVVTAPPTFNGSATITVSNPNINCSGSIVVWIGAPPAPGVMNWGAWVGHNCYSWAEWTPIPNATNYSYQYGLGTGTSYGTVTTFAQPHTVTGWAPGTTLHVRVKSNNTCGSSAWQVLQSTTPTSPNYPNCNQ